MKILITGGSSLLGKYLLNTAPPGFRIDATWYTNYIGPWTNYKMSVSSPEQVDYVVNRCRPDIIIHCAANGSVDYAEKNYERVYRVNVLGTQNLMQSALKSGCKFVYISSNAVYDGAKPPYNEFDVRQPVNKYGEIKKLGEDCVMGHKANWVVIRPYLLYGYPWKNGRENWVTTIVKAASTGGEIKLVNDVIWQPTYAGDCAKAIWKLAGQTQKAFNISSGESMNLYEFGLKIVKAFGLSKESLIPVQSDHFVNIAARPKDTSYDLSTLDRLGIKLSNVDEGLKKMKGEGA